MQLVVYADDVDILARSMIRTKEVFVQFAKNQQMAVNFQADISVSFIVFIQKTARLSWKTLAQGMYPLPPLHILGSLS